MAAAFLRDVRYSARSLARTPALAVSLILTIALGIASNASVDGFMRGLLAQQRPFPPDAMASIRLLLRTAAITVFVIACANVAAFLLARATARSRETAVRVAIGAGRRQLVQQALADSLVISVAGAAAGAILANWITRIVPALLFDQDAAQMSFRGDAATLSLVALGGAVITVMCGLLPLIEMRHDNPAAIMQRENSGPSVASLRIGAGLVIFQMAACTLLVISAGLLVAGYRSALQTSTGRRLSHATIAGLDALQMSSKSLEAANAAEYFDGAARAARDVTGAATVGWVAIMPGNRPTTRSFTFERPGLPLRSVTLERRLFTRAGGNEVLLPPVAGRLFRSIDTGECGGIVLSTAAAEQLGPSPIVGRSIQTPVGWSEVIGIVKTRDAQRPIVYHYAPDADPSPGEPGVYRIADVKDAPRSELLANVVSRNYFEMLGLRIVAGKSFEEAPAACRIAIVNEEAADLYFGEGAVGGAIIDANGVRTQIVGVVSSARLRVSSRDVEPTIFFPMDQDFQPRMTMIIETDAPSGAMLRELHQRLQMIRGGRPERIKVDTLEHHLSRTAFAPERVVMVLVSASAAIALLLGVLGLYGVMADAARRRRREFALRIALGAQAAHVVRQVVLEATRLVVLGAVAGWAGSFVIAHWVTQIAPSTEGGPRLMWVAAPMALAAAIGIASIIPARTAAASDPLLIMRSE